jgi:serine/threonine protein kinase
MSATVACPRCSKSLADAPAGAQFCIFCGSKLSTSSDKPTVDTRTRSHVPAHSVSPDDDDNDADTPPKSVGGYQLVRILGAGGQGSVYEAEQSDTGQRVALKLLSTKYAGSAISVERFRQEGRLASQLSHPRCVFVYGADTDSGVPFIVMELMPGTTLKDMVDRRGPLPVGEAIARILDVIDGLIEAHRLGVIHRDVKPSNCFLTADDRVKVGDFGLSKSLVGSNPGKQLTTSGKFVGTVLFAPPEQIRGEEVGYDSDVYSAAATLYFLLTGQAPHQHESLTAALAKAISEAPPSIRDRRADVPKELDRCVLKGLERDRTRRWQSLEEFRDALLDLLPSRLTPARPRSLIAAYMLDSLIFSLLVQLPVELLRESLSPGSGVNIGIRAAFDLPLLLLSMLYYALFEGLIGFTAAKWLLRLRVVRMGQTGPPGVVKAFLRTAVFHAIWLGLVVLPGIFIGYGQQQNAAIFFFCVILGIGVGISCLIVLCNQLRKRWAYRGVHDLASGCRVVQKPFRVERRRLISKFANPLDRTVAAAADLPESVGGFVVRGSLGAQKDGTLVWVGEDRSLARRVLIWLRSVDSNDEFPSAVVRPTRLRQVGDGCLDWNGHTYAWVAHVAPTGAPLADVADPDDPISWADARPLLEQLTDEFRAAVKDGSRPKSLEIDQVWVEPAGRLHVLDYPIANVRGVANLDTTNPEPIDLIRQTAALALSGKPWDIGEPIAAPLPPHARAICDRLARLDSPYRDLDVLDREITESHGLPTRVTAGQRGTHVALQWMFLAFPNLLGVVIALAAFMNVIVAFGVGMYAASFEKVEAMAKAPAKLAAVAGRDELREALAPTNREATFRMIAERAERARRLRDTVVRSTLTPPERGLVNYLVDLVERTDAIRSDERLQQEQLVTSLRRAHETELLADGTVRIRTPGSDRGPPDPLRTTADDFPFREAMAIALSVGIVAFLANRFLLAVIFRGGLTWLLAGLTIVANDGPPAGRVWCGLRALAVWTPLVLVVALLVAVQFYVPTALVLRVLVVIALAATCIGYAVVAIRQPSRPPQDRLMGTHIVPM